MLVGLVRLETDVPDVPDIPDGGLIGGEVFLIIPIFCGWLQPILMVR